MKDIMKHLPLTLSVLTFLMVGSMWMDSRESGCANCTGMRAARMSQPASHPKMKMKGSRGDSGRMRREEGKRGPKKEDK